MILENVVIELEFHEASIQEIFSQVYPYGFNFFSEDVKKTRQIYEFILLDTVSIGITHVPDHNDPSWIVYSKFKKNQVLTPSHWPQGMFIPKTFSKAFNPYTYNYRDYTRAWYKILWHEPTTVRGFLHFVKNLTKLVFLIGFKNGEATLD